MKKAEIQKMQDRYNEWMALLPELEKSVEQWKKAAALLEPLSKFYTSPKWQELHESFDEPLETQGNYSVLSEDALWNALTDQHRLAVEWLKLATEVIAKD